MADPARNNSPTWCGPAVALNESGPPSQGATAETTAGTGTPAAHFSLAGGGVTLVQGSALAPSPAHTPIPGLGLAASTAGSAVGAPGAMAAAAPTFPQQPSTAGGGGLIASVAAPACALSYFREKAAPAPNNCPHCDGEHCNDHCTCGAQLEVDDCGEQFCPEPENHAAPRREPPPFVESDIPW